MVEDNGAPVNPTMLAWARERAGFTLDHAAEKLGVRPDTVLEWEDGRRTLTFGRLDDLCALYKRPSGLFYLEEPPTEETALPQDFRSGPADRPTPGLIYVVRRARERRLVALDLHDELAEEPAAFPFACERSDDPESAGAKLAAALGRRGPEEPWRDDHPGYKAFNAWKSAAETHGVLVFQAPEREIGAARGLSLHDRPLPVIVLRSSDSVPGRVFTLLHELTHLGLRQAAVCDLHDGGLERFCNAVAAAALMPRVDVKRLVSELGGDADRALARSFGVSEEAMSLRLLGLGLRTQAAHDAKARLFAARTRRKEPAEKSGGPAPHVTVMAHNGIEFTRLVIDAFQRGLVPAHRASTYLGTTYPQLAKIQEEMDRRLARAS